MSIFFLGLVHNKACRCYMYICWYKNDGRLSCLNVFVQYVCTYMYMYHGSYLSYIYIGFDPYDELNITKNV